MVSMMNGELRGGEVKVFAEFLLLFLRLERLDQFVALCSEGKIAEPSKGPPHDLRATRCTDF